MKSKKPVFLFLLSFLLSFPIISQNSFSTPAGARGIGMGNANLTFRDIYGGFNNQAGLAYVDGLSGAVFAENRFLLKELQLVALSVAKPTVSGTFGLTLEHFGFKDYNEQKIGLNYSRKLFENLAIGAQFDFLTTNIADYGSASTITFEFGLQYDLMETLIAGVHIFNPIRVSISEEELPSILQIGLTYQVAKYFAVSTSVEKDTNLPYNFRLGLEYKIYDQIFFRAGFNSAPSKLSFGLGYQLKKIQLNVAASYHDVFGVSPSFGVFYQAGKPRKRKK